MNKIKFGSKGYYTVQVLSKEGYVKDEKTSDNVVTYQGAYNRFFGSDNGTFNRSGFFATMYAVLGTGTQELTRTSTSLGNQVGPMSSIGTTTSNRSNSEVDNGDGTATVTSTNVMSFDLGDLVGTFSEVGIHSSSNTASTFIAGQLIKDEFGNPTTITVLADEQVVVTYTLEFTYPTVPNLVGTGTVTDAASNSYNYEIWAQPYFADYNIGLNSTNHRYFPTSSEDEWFFRDATGTNSYNARVDTGTGWNNRISLGENGLVTATTQPYTFAPSSFEAVDIVFAGAYSANADSPSFDIINGDTAPLTGGVGTFVVKFLNPISKTSSQSFSIQVELEIQL